MAPELIALFPLLINSNKIDVFAFSMVVLEVSNLLSILMFCAIFAVSTAMIDHRPFAPIWLRCRVMPDYTLLTIHQDSDRKVTLILSAPGGGGRRFYTGW
jgi:hypothetical protein